MGSVCECCIAAYCSCRRGRSGGKCQNSLAVEEDEQPPPSHLLGFHKQWEIWKSSERSCVVHSRCSLCNRPLGGGGGGGGGGEAPGDRSVKRKLAKVYSLGDGEDVQQIQQAQQKQEQIQGTLKGGESSEGEVRESHQAKKQKDMNVQTEGGGSDKGELKWLMEALEAERQVVNALYLELEEERHASAVAATESLAMITRLQEEKAAVQMEASQYKRMAEEKSNYEAEVFGILNAMLSAQEEENLALSKEVETYRSSGDKQRSRTVEAGRPSENGALKGSDDEYIASVEKPTTKAGGNKVQGRNLMSSLNAVEERKVHRSPGRKSATKAYVEEYFEEGEVYEQNPRATSSHRDEDEKYWKKHGQAASRDLRRAYDRLDAGSSSDGHSRFDDEQAERNSRREGRLMELGRRLEALEADRTYLKQSYGSPRNDGMDLLAEISEQLRQMQAMERKADDVKELSEASFVFSFKGFFSFSGLRKSLNSNLNRLACMFIKHTEAGGLNYSEHYAGLSNLLEGSRKSSRNVPFITRGIKVDNPPMLPSSYAIHRQNVQWPVDARGRSDTAFNGWDY